jgi:hypothetical protein
MHQTVLPGKYVLQVDEVVNMATGAKDRYTDASNGVSRMLKLMMTDGAHSRRARTRAHARTRTSPPSATSHSVPPLPLCTTHAMHHPGAQRVMGVEFRHIKDLSWELEAGTKARVNQCASLLL